MWYALYYNGSIIDPENMATILNSNIQESKEFIIHVFDYRIFITFLIILLPFILLYFMKPFKINKYILIFMGLFIIISFSLIYDKRWVKREIAVTYIYDTYKRTINDKKLFFEMLNEADKTALYFDNITSSLNTKKHTFVFIISESQNKLHFSLYGYNKKTTPYLDSIKDELYVFNDVFSPSVHTNSSVEKMITFSDNHNRAKGYSSGDIIRFFQNAGFYTYWLSNQYFIGEHESLYSAIAYRADKAIFLNKISGHFLETKNHDSALIDVFKNALNDKHKNKFIVLHLMGSHTPYNQRYPKNFGSFNYKVGLNDIMGGLSKQKEIATYDNSIQFTDYVLKNIIELLKNEKSQSYLLFLSDHGVDVYDTNSNKTYPRNISTITRSMVQIPFFIWFSDSYKISYPHIIDRVKVSLNRPYQTDMVDHTLLDLSMLKHDIFNTSDSIISNNFIPKKRIIGNVNLDKDLK